MPGTRLSALAALLIGAMTLSACSGSDSSGSAPESAETIQSIEAQSTVEWMSAPVIPVFDRRSRSRFVREVRRSKRAGSRAGVFAKIGDSNTDYPQNLYGLGCRPVRLGSHQRLRSALHRYRQTRFGQLEAYRDCKPTNSFSRRSVAAVSGVWTDWLLTPLRRISETGLLAQQTTCPGRLSPVECELKLLRPRYAQVMIGSNDVLLGRPLGSTFAAHLRDLIQTVRAGAAVPVLSTLAPIGAAPDLNQKLEQANEVIWRVSREMRVPLINLWRALTAPGMINEGLAADDVHLGVQGGENSARVLQNSAILTRRAIRHGANRRNLIWLQTLDRLDRLAARGQ